MRNLIDHLSQYGDYHRDPRNIHTHFVGVPMIMFAVVVLLARASFGVGGMAVNLAMVAAVAAVLFYLMLDLRYGLAMGALIGVMLVAAQVLAAQPLAIWLAWGVGLFVVGWIIQFIGHHYEGRKPAFVDDLVGLIIGPLFVVAEWGFAMGLRRAVQQAIESRIGPVRRRESAAPALKA